MRNLENCLIPQLHQRYMKKSIYVFLRCLSSCVLGFFLSDFIVADGIYYDRVNIFRCNIQLFLWEFILGLGIRFKP